MRASSAITVVSVGAGVLVLAYGLRWNVLAVAGGVSAVQTNPPALAAATGLAPSDASAVAVTRLYPVALIGKILLAEAVVLVLHALESW
jgi:putative transport protein